MSRESRAETIAFYKTKAWLKCRDGFIKTRYGIDGGLCQRCHKEPGYIVHHRTWITPANVMDPDITLNESNLEFVCKSCHDKIHNYCNMQKEKRREITFDADGNPIAADDPPRLGGNR